MNNIILKKYMQNILKSSFWLFSLSLIVQKLYVIILHLERDRSMINYYRRLWLAAALKLAGPESTDGDLCHRPF